MPKNVNDITGLSSIDGQWNDRSPFERLQMILQHADHFLDLGLVARVELEKVLACSEAEWEYVITRQEQPLFLNINLKKDLTAQNLRTHIQTALGAVFN